MRMFTSFTDFSTLPLYAQWNNGLLWGATLVNIVVLVGGRLLRPGKQAADGASIAACSWGDCIASLALLLLFGLINSAGHSSIGQPAATEYNLSFLCYSFALFVPWLAWYNKTARSGQPGVSIRALGLALLAAVGGHTFNIVFDCSGLYRLIVDATGSPPLQDSIYLIQSGTLTSRACVIIAAVVLAPITEECCFRGILYRSLRNLVGVPVAVLLSSLFFAAIHMALGQTVPLMVFAVLLCLLYERTRSLRYCIAAHAVFNLITVVASLLIRFE